MLNKEMATKMLYEMVQNESLRRHSITVGLVMEAYAKKLGQPTEKWAATGILHDADYETFPKQHPDIIVQKMNDMNEPEVAHAISAHYTKWGVPYNTLLDKALLACDELTGFVVAAALIRPTKIVGLTVKSVKKRLKNPKFAAGVERDEVYKGVELLGVDLDEHIQLIIDTLEAHKEELNLV